MAVPWPMVIQKSLVVSNRRLYRQEIKLFGIFYDGRAWKRRKKLNVKNKVHFLLNDKSQTN